MKIYFAGAIRGGREDREIHNQLVTLLAEFGTVLTEHIGDVALGATGDPGLTVKEIYERDMAWINEADVVVAEVTTPSLGVGYELRYAESKGIPTLCLFREEGRSLSAMIAGADYFAGNIRVYTAGDVDGVRKYVSEFLVNLTIESV